jgi:XTP/dITP diphosphohydrolase
MRSLIIATENTGKFEEIKVLLANEFDMFYSLRSFEEKVVVEENSPLYIENAMKKARKIGDRFGIYTVADDSGLEVEALDGRPGVYSSRYGKNDKERIERLLSEMEGVPQEKRGAVFKVYLSFYMPEKERNCIFYGQLAGYIGFEKKGMSGFGFDSIFFIPRLRKSLAELTMDEKNKMSHRGKAVWALKNFLNADLFKSPRVLNL